MKRISLCIGFLGMVFISYSQGSISFLEKTHDFGEVKEEAGPIDHSFAFVNTGDQPIKIVAVNASCGCTTPGWSQEEIAPSDSGYVTAQYNPLNRPGGFRKSLQITYSNGSGADNEVLYITGSVKPKPTTIEDELSTLVGDLRFKYRSLNLGKVTTEKRTTKTFDVYNNSDSVITWLGERAELPNHISVTYEPRSLQSRELGQISITYDPELKNDLGFVSDNIKLQTSELESGEKELFVITTIEEYFPPMSEDELASAPKLSFNEIQHDFGKVKEGDVLKTTFELINNGEKTLEIRKTKENCSCTVAELSKRKVKPGKSVEMSVSFDTAGRRGRQYKTVTVFSNDPTAPSQMITVKAEVSE